MTKGQRHPEAVQPNEQGRAHDRTSTVSIDTHSLQPTSGAHVQQALITTDQKELYDSTSNAGEDTVCCTQCGKRMEMITACFSRYDGEPLCAACAQAGEVQE